VLSKDGVGYRLFSSKCIYYPSTEPPPSESLRALKSYISAQRRDSAEKVKSQYARRRRDMKKSMEIIKDRSTYYAINMIIDLLSKVSADTFVSLTYWGEKLTRDPESRCRLQKVAGSILGMLN